MPWLRAARRMGNLTSKLQQEFAQMQTSALNLYHDTSPRSRLWGAASPQQLSTKSAAILHLICDHSLSNRHDNPHRFSSHTITFLKRPATHVSWKIEMALRPSLSEVSTSAGKLKDIRTSLRIAQEGVAVILLQVTESLLDLQCASSPNFHLLHKRLLVLVQLALLQLHPVTRQHASLPDFRPLHLTRIQGYDLLLGRHSLLLTNQQAVDVVAELFHASKMHGQGERLLAHLEDCPLKIQVIIWCMGNFMKALQAKERPLTTRGNQEPYWFSVGSTVAALMRPRRQGRKDAHCKDERDLS